MFQSFYPWGWTTTVADIRPIRVSGETSASDTLMTWTSLLTDRSQSGPIARSACDVEVTGVVRPSAFGQRDALLVAGLFRSQWLDVLLTFETLAKLHTQAANSYGSCTIPLTVKTNQLAGPLTGGQFFFFFSGARVPFARILDCAFRLVLGALLGLALVIHPDAHKTSALVFADIAATAAAAAYYAATRKPLNRQAENFAVISSYCIAALGGVAFAMLQVAGVKGEVFADCLLGLVAVALIGLTAYTSLVALLTTSALLFPQLREYKFLERLCNVAVVVSSPRVGFAVDTIGFSRYQMRDLQLQCRRSGSQGLEVQCSASSSSSSSSSEAVPFPTVEVSLRDLVKACSAARLPMPKCCLFVHDAKEPLGYRNLNLMEGEGSAKLRRWLQEGTHTAAHADQLLSAISRELEVRRSEKSVISMTLIGLGGGASHPVSAAMSAPTGRSSWSSISMSSSAFTTRSPDGMSSAFSRASPPKSSERRGWRNWAAPGGAGPLAASSSIVNSIRNRTGRTTPAANGYAKLNRGEEMVELANNNHQSRNYNNAQQTMPNQLYQEHNQFGSSSAPNRQPMILQNGSSSSKPHYHHNSSSSARKHFRN
eukprot:GHVT01042958.1.p1 GENE.GHVT01042958.1~~GHVT01042958.1.p1  ORF type:complete len:597 (+),score=157.80 GHVT01042958.1:203-1993(+)